MTIEFTEDFEGAPDGTLMTPSTTAFDTINWGNSPADTPTHSNLHSVTGGLSMRILDNLTTAAYARRSLTARSKSYRRCYVLLDKVPDSAAPIFGVYFGNTLRAQVRVRPTQVFDIRNGTTILATSTLAMTLGQWYRLEWYAETGVGQTLRIFTGTNLHGTVPDETLTGVYDTGTHDRLYLGNSAGSAIDMFFDAVADSPDAWIGPVSSYAFTATAPLTGTGTLGASGGSSGIVNSAPFNGTGTLATNRSVAVRGTATLAGSGTMTALGSVFTFTSRTHAHEGTATTTLASAAAEGYTTLTSTAPTYLADAAVGSTSLLFASGSVGYLTDDSLGTATDIWVRAYCMIPAAVTSSSQFLTARSGGGTIACVRVSGTSLDLAIRDAGATNLDHTGSPLLIGAWYRLLWHINIGSQTQTLQVWDAPNATGGSPWTLTGAVGAGPVEQLDVGQRVVASAIALDAVKLDRFTVGPASGTFPQQVWPFFDGTAIVGGKILGYYDGSLVRPVQFDSIV